MASSSCICGGYSELCSHQIILCGFMKFANHSILFLFAFYTGSQLFENLGCSCHKTACKFSVLVMPLSWEWSFLHTAKIMCKMLMPSSTEIWIWTPRLCSKRKKMQCKNQIQITNASYQRPWETLVLVIDALKCDIRILLSLCSFWLKLIGNKMKHSVWNSNSNLEKQMLVFWVL